MLGGQHKLWRTTISEHWKLIKSKNTTDWKTKHNDWIAKSLNIIIRLNNSECVDLTKLKNTTDRKAKYNGWVAKSAIIVIRFNTSECVDRTNPNDTKKLIIEY